MAAIWEIYWVPQQESIKKTTPPQPTDNSKSHRAYVLIAPPDFRNKFTCCPIQDRGQRITMTEVELSDGYGGFITKNCKILCHEIYTLPEEFFKPFKKLGSLLVDEREKVRFGVKAYLRIH
jgi:mRNA-degrading endonuclease toxin of MazEF toxin-antitoxin module